VKGEMKKLHQEIWKVIKDFPDYEVSNLGRVKSLKFGNERILKSKKNNQGYLYVDLWKNGKPYIKRIHRLVLENFDPVDNMDKLQCNHKNGIKDDNRYPENLEWVTKSENVKHAYKIGLKNHKGENNPQAILTEKNIIEIRKLSKEGISTQKEIAEKFGVSEGKRWSHINMDDHHE